MTLIEQMQEKLQAALTPEVMKIIDDSPRHYGHDFAEEGKVSHVALLVVSKQFEGQSRVARQRKVHAAVREEIAAIHAITALKTYTPEEYELIQA